MGWRWLACRGVTRGVATLLWGVPTRLLWGVTLWGVATLRGVPLWRVSCGRTTCFGEGIWRGVSTLLWGVSSLLWRVSSRLWGVSLRGVASLLLRGISLGRVSCRLLWRVPCGLLGRISAWIWIV